MQKINITGIILLLLFYNTTLYPQSTAESAIKLGEFKWYTIEDFETCYRWPIINKTYIEKEWIYRNPTIAIHYGASKDLTVEKKVKCLGVKMKMDHYGDTRKFVIPLYNLDIKGICQKISFWVHSRNKELTFKIILKDYWNSYHYLEPTYYKLDFYGWKKLEVDNIDKKIVDQMPTTAPDYQPLQFLGFVIENPLHKVHYDPVYIYIDQLEAFCRVDDFTDYDGFNMPTRW